MHYCPSMSRIKLSVSVGIHSVLREMPLTGVEVDVQTEIDIDVLIKHLVRVLRTSPGLLPVIFSSSLPGSQLTGSPSE